MIMTYVRAVTSQGKSSSDVMDENIEIYKKYDVIILLFSSELYMTL